MEPVSFNATLRLPNYWSEGIIIFSDNNGTTEVIGLFTTDIIYGELSNDFLKLTLIKRYSGKMYDQTISINIRMEEIYSPCEYSFSYKNSNDSILNILSVDKDQKNVNYVMSYIISHL